MTKDEAKQEVQKLLVEAKEKIAAAEKLMDEHRFSAGLLGKDYCPKDLTQEEVDEREAADGEYLPIGQYDEVGYGGNWQSSSDMC